MWWNIIVFFSTLIFVSSSSEILTFGSNSNGQLGKDNTITLVSTPQLLNLSAFPAEVGNATDLACGYLHSIIATGLGVITFGDNSRGQLGIGNRNQTWSIQFLNISFFNSQVISQVSAGQYHSVAITVNGSVFTWGDNSNGQLGFIQNASIPILIQPNTIGNETIIQIATGLQHTVLLSSLGNIWVFGGNTFGQLGLGFTSSSQSTPFAIPRSTFGNENLIFVSAGYFNTLAITASGKVYVTGDNSFGQLANVQSQVVDFTLLSPQSINCEQIGLATIGTTTILVTASGNFYTFGSNIFGGLLNQTASNYSNSPILINSTALPVIQLSSAEHTLLLSASGSVSVFGRNDFSQLGLGFTNPFLSSLITLNNTLVGKSVSKVAVGGMHSLLLIGTPKTANLNFSGSACVSTSGGITSGSISTGTITTGSITTGTISTGTESITSGSVTTGSISTGTITTGTENLTTGSISTGSITTGTVSTGTENITSASISTGSISTGTENLSTGTISTESLTSGSVTTSSISTGSISTGTENLTTGSISTGTESLTNGSTLTTNPLTTARSIPPSNNITNVNFSAIDILQSKDNDLETKWIIAIAAGGGGLLFIVIVVISSICIIRKGRTQRLIDSSQVHRKNSVPQPITNFWVREELGQTWIMLNAKTTVT